MGEFGRSPVMTQTAGRGHWTNCMSMLVAGGGLPLRPGDRLDRSPRLRHRVGPGPSRGPGGDGLPASGYRSERAMDQPLRPADPNRHRRGPTDPGAVVEASEGIALPQTRQRLSAKRLASPLRRMPHRLPPAVCELRSHRSFLTLCRCAHREKVRAIHALTQLACRVRPSSLRIRS